ncbi:MAG: hypothetical protein L6R39_006709, partial [Caloplaca ligustica]
MRQGSTIHKTLEDEVHRTVVVDIETKEDAWGLRIWNIIQGLRTLRETGMTREFEVWGVLDGLVVNGVIDELSYTCPAPDLEEAAELPGSIPAADQSTITDFLSPNNSQTLSQANFGVSTYSSETAPKIYITDVKTRTSPTVPKASAFRPTLMQLMLYHRLLSSMATATLDTDVLFKRYDLHPHAPFTDTLIAQHSQMFYDAPTHPSQTNDADSALPSSTPEMDQDTLSLLLTHNSLSLLWTLMTREFATTFPRGANSIGNILQAEYRSATDGRVMGSKTAVMDEEVLEG